MSRILNAGATLGLLLVGSIAASAADNVRIRGKIEMFNDQMLTVKTREGGTANITLAKDWKVSSVAKAAVADIKQGDFLGVASLPAEDGKSGALEVVIFPAEMKGAGEGDRPWDLKPKSSMTNGTASQLVTGTDGKTVTLSYKGQEKTITISPETPIVTFAPATTADMKAGAAVFVPAENGSDGTFTASRVVVETNGVAPPM